MERAVNIVIIDSDPSSLSALTKEVSRLGYSPISDFKPDMPVDKLEALRPDLAILGPTLSQWDCQRCLHKLKIVNPSMPVLIPHSDAAVQEAGDRVAFEGIYYVNAELEADEISRTIGIALSHSAESEIPSDCPIIIGESDEIREIKQKIQNVAEKDVTVLITGETGSGKELIARSIHCHSLRRKGPLVKISCGALPDDLLESEIFGFQKGAFTGAYKSKPGRLEMAHDGTLFIDEIGDLSLSLQVKFLQILEDNVFARLGGTEDTIIEARVIAATNKDLWQRMGKGLFRKDLFYRLNVLHIRAPGLRQRKDDLPLLTHYFLNKYCFSLRRELLDVPGDVARHFQSYNWPGNVRELENVVRRAVVLRDWGFVFDELNLASAEGEKEDGLAPHEDSSAFGWADEKIRESMRDTDFSLKKITKAYVSAAERQAILEALEQTQWNRKQAAEILGVSYKTLLSRIEEFKLKP